MRKRADELSLRGVVFLQHDAAEAGAALAEVPLHVDEPFAAVVIVEQRRVEADGVEEDGSDQGPWMSGAVVRKIGDVLEDRLPRVRTLV